MADFGSLAGMEVYAAGPPPMIEALSAAFPSRGLPPDHMHLDAFFYAAPQPD
jgi:CDP-4-dehydro-6-deoxyglucose reductase